MQRSAGAVNNLVCRCVKATHTTARAGLGMAGKQAAVSADLQHSGLGAVISPPTSADAVPEPSAGPDHLQERLAEWEQSVDASGLTDAEAVVHRAHLEAVKAGHDSYLDPRTGFVVFTVLAHLRRGSCCGNLCRHCPYQHSNCGERYKELAIYNRAFYQ